MSLPVNLPMPNAAETARFADLYAAQTGVRLSSADAYGVLSRLVHYLYLTEYAPVRPLRPDDGLAGPGARRARDYRLRGAKASETRRRNWQARLDHEDWYGSLGDAARDALDA